MDSNALSYLSLIRAIYLAFPEITPVDQAGLGRSWQVLTSDDGQLFLGRLLFHLFLVSPLIPGLKDHYLESPPRVTDDNLSVSGSDAVRKCFGDSGMVSEACQNIFVRRMVSVDGFVSEEIK